MWQAVACARVSSERLSMQFFAISTLMPSMNFSEETRKGMTEKAKQGI